MKSFFKTFLASFLGSALLLIVLFIVMITNIVSSIVASSETAVTVSASAVEHMERVNHELRQVKKLAARLQNASEE
mgnify:CR=1 FL=1